MASSFISFPLFRETSKKKIERKRERGTQNLRGVTTGEGRGRRGRGKGKEGKGKEGKGRERGRERKGKREGKGGRGRKGKEEGVVEDMEERYFV